MNSDSTSKLGQLLLRGWKAVIFRKQLVSTFFFIFFIYLFRQTNKLINKQIDQIDKLFKPCRICMSFVFLKYC